MAKTGWLKVQHADGSAATSSDSSEEEEGSGDPSIMIVEREALGIPRAILHAGDLLPIPTERADGGELLEEVERMSAEDPASFSGDAIPEHHDQWWEKKCAEMGHLIDPPM